MYSLHLIFLLTIFAKTFSRSLTESNELVVPTESSATDIINIYTLDDHCNEDGVCQNFNFPNKSQIAFFDLKPQIRILDKSTYNYENPHDFETLVFKKSTFFHFPLHFFYAVTVRELDMRNCSIETITWDNFLMAKNLQILLLSQNKIQSITEMTFNYANDLQYLFLNLNRLHTLVSESFKGLTKLRYLDLSYNRLRNLPGMVFAYLPILHELNLEGNRLRYLPNEIFSKNHDLTTVILRNNDLRTLDEYLFKNQPNLVFVDISHNKQLEQLIMNIQSQYLIAANCSLYRVNLYGHIISADFRDNRIVELYFAQPESLEKLVLRNNALVQIASLTYATNLRDLDISDNPGIEYLPAQWSVNSLERLDLSNISLHQLPISNIAEQQNLQFLNVSYNKIKKINPINYIYLEKLTHFDINANDWNCYNLKLLMDLLIKPKRITYKHDQFNEDFPGEYIEGIACMYRLENEEDENSAEVEESNLNTLIDGNKPLNEHLAQQTSQPYTITNEYPTNGVTENDVLKREVENFRKELKAIVLFYENKFDILLKQMNELKQRLDKFEQMNATMFEHITVIT